MASLEDIVAASEILDEDPDNIMSGSTCKRVQNRARVFSVKKDDDSVVVVAKGAVGAETVVESAFDSSSGLDGMREQETGDGNLGSVSNGGTSFTGNGVDDRVGVAWGDHKIKDGKVSGTYCTKLNGSRENGSYAVVNVDGKQAANGGKLKDQDCEFRVGDFVWGKIKSHPWWPGQVYDTKDASDFALKHSQEGRLLVAFFGDGSCSWCLPSQLIPFVENFKEMSMDSSSKSSSKAIQMAVDEIGRVVESETTCKCIPLEKRDGLARPVVANAGVRVGVLVPEVDIHRLPIPEYGPAEILAEVMHFAKAVSVDSVLELAILRSWLSAFFRTRDRHSLPVYHEPHHIEGLEDKNRNATGVTNDFSVPIEVPIFGPRGDDWLSPPAVNTATSQAPLDDKIYHRRKLKSVAELMGENGNAKPKSHSRATVKEGKDLGKSASSKESTGLKRKVEVSESSKITNEKISDSENSGIGVMDGLDNGTWSRKPNESVVATGENTSGEAKEESEHLSMPRERKRSKYLSPPYIDSTWRIGNLSFKMESESDKVAKVDRVGEHRTKASEDIKSPPVSKSLDESSVDKLPIDQQLNVHETSIDTASVTAENGKNMTFPVSDVNVPVSECLANLQFAAVDRLYLSKAGTLDTVWAFVSALRSSTYLHGENFKIYQRFKAGRKRNRKRKSVPSRLPNQENDIKQEKSKPAYKKTPKALKSKGEPDTSKSKKTEVSCAKSSADKSEGHDTPCLTLTFTPGFPMPSKEEIVRLFSKFGRLNEKEMNVVTDSHAVRIAYMHNSDAQAAFKSSLNENPFSAENVNYGLQHSSKTSSPRKLGPERPASSSQRTDDYMSDVRVIRRKLEIMTAILENYNSKFSPEEKSSLKDEMRHLMDNVETASEKVRVMAENVSY